MSFLISPESSQEADVGGVWFHCIDGVVWPEKAAMLSLFEYWNLCLSFVGSPNSVGRSSRFGGGACVYICSFEKFWFRDDSQSLGWV